MTLLVEMMTFGDGSSILVLISLYEGEELVDHIDIGRVLKSHSLVSIIHRPRSSMERGASDSEVPYVEGVVTKSR